MRRQHWEVHGGGCGDGGIVVNLVVVRHARRYSRPGGQFSLPVKQASSCFTAPPNQHSQQCGSAVTRWWWGRRRWGLAPARIFAGIQPIPMREKSSSLRGSYLLLLPRYRQLGIDKTNKRQSDKGDQQRHQNRGAS